ncbi:MAG: TrmH family RNA methyltransferase, partial [Eubacteriales bacterium]
LAIAKVSNIASTIDVLKNKGLWTFAAEAGGSPYYDTDMSVPAAIVLGSEGNGISELVKKKCDYIVSIPMYGKVNSFNVSTAAAVILSEAARQQRLKKQS